MAESVSVMSLSPSILLLFSFAVSSASIDLNLGDQYGCSFDTDVCDWAIEGPVNHMGPGVCDHGWPNDAIHGVTAPSRYMCFHLESLPVGTDRARLTSPAINTTHPVVMSFAVGTVRPPNSTYLSVFTLNETVTTTEAMPTTESYTESVSTVIMTGGQDETTLPAITDSSHNSAFKTTGYTKETSKPSEPSTTPSATSKSEEAPTESAQRGDANTIPIALGTTGGILFVAMAIGAFVLWKTYPKKAVVSPGKTPEVHDQVP
uniref:MAM domain-containing protein n=1 Tax=Branchiostoma floridae TaxID=7739 RepID=C3YQX3_BRAFL|eukprot:XP_002601302.1 hypothetical protein BRAFLDRAFT_81342 [Branchiostoma floridae]